MLKQFYEKALPREGYYCVAYNNRDDDRFPHQYATSIEELVELIESYREHQRNVFVAIGSFSEKKREASKAIYVKSFYIDLDVGESKEYQTQKEAVIALSKFLEDTKLPLPAIVNSGNGIHAYWFLKEQLPITEWKTLAVQLKQLCIQKELKILIAEKITAVNAPVF